MKDIRFDNFIKLNRGFDLPDYKIEKGEYPVITSTNIKAFHKEYKVDGPMVVTGRSGSLGKVQYIEGKCWPLNTSLYVKDYKGNFPRYVYYFLQMMHLEQYNAGAGVPTLNQNHLHSLKIKIHEIEIQQKIASILSAYDRLIENNTRRIRLLEQMAENLYKEWFVRFRFPGHENVEMVKSKYGRVPSNFNIIKMQEAFDYYIGGGWGQEEQTNDFSVQASVIRGTDFPKVRQYDISTCPRRFHKKRNYQARQLEDGDIIMEISGGTSEQPVGRVALITQEIIDRFEDSKVICASFCKLIRLQMNLVSPYFFYYWMSFLYNTRMITRFQLQSTGIVNFQFESFLRKGEIMLPTMTIMKSFEKRISSIHKQINKLAQQNTLLTRQRDLLLPRLMSGKIEVKP